MKTNGIHHLGLAVSDLAATRSFFVEGLGWQVAKELPDYPACFVSNGDAFLTLWQTEAEATPFNRRSNVGLHHFAIRVPSEADLHAVYERVKTIAGVVIAFAPEALGEGPAQHFMLFEPSGIRLEFIHVPG